MPPHLAEFIGTAILVTLGDGVVTDVVLSQTKGQNGGWIVISAGWALAVTFAVYCVGSVSGGPFKPAVTLAMAIMGDLAWATFTGFIAAQIAGGGVSALFYRVTWSLIKPNPQEPTRP